MATNFFWIGNHLEEFRSQVAIRKKFISCSGVPTLFVLMLLKSTHKNENCKTNKQEETHQWEVRHQYQFFYDQSLDQLHLDEGQFEICTLQLICSIEVCEQKHGKKSTTIWLSWEMCILKKTLFHKEHSIHWYEYSLSICKQMSLKCNYQFIVSVKASNTL